MYKVKFDYSEKFYNFVKENINGTYRKDMYEMVKKEFNYPFTYETFTNYLKKNKFRNNIDTKLKKGCASYTKGKKLEDFLTPEQIEKVKLTWFKKGNVPHNKKNIGDISDNHTYKSIKVDDDKWVQYHLYLYEKYYGIKPQKGQCVIFLDGNKDNFNKDNLMLIDRGTHSVLNNKKLRFDDKDMTRCAVAMVELNGEVKKSGV